MVWIFAAQRLPFWGEGSLFALLRAFITLHHTGQLGAPRLAWLSRPSFAEFLVFSWAESISNSDQRQSGCRPAAEPRGSQLEILALRRVVHRKTVRGISLSSDKPRYSTGPAPDRTMTGGRCDGLTVRTACVVKLMIAKHAGERL